MDFRLADGWGPLCEFLGKDVPDVEFPHVNETAALQEKIKGVQKEMLSATLKKVAPWALGLGLAIVAYYVY